MLRLVTDSFQVPLKGTDTPKTASNAAREAAKQLSRPGTPHFNPEVHDPQNDVKQSVENDDFAARIISRSPAKMVEREIISVDTSSEQGENNSETGDSFIAKISSRSPVKKSLFSPSESPSRARGVSPRIEDSVEALDKLNDAIEAVEALDGMISDRESVAPRKTKKGTTPKAKTAATKATRGTTITSREPVSVTTKKIAPIAPKTNKLVKEGAPTSALRRTQSTVAVRQSARQATPKKVASVASLKSDRAPAAVPTKSSAVSRTDSSDATTTIVPTAKARPVSVSFPPPPQAVKSSKAVTRPIFELPGEAVARRLKEQREERQKRAEESQASGLESFKSRSNNPSVKSSKAVTKADFELPGEAVARKLKEQREERQKRMEEASQLENEALKNRLSNLATKRMSTIGENRRPASVHFGGSAEGLIISKRSSVANIGVPRAASSSTSTSAPVRKASTQFQPGISQPGLSARTNLSAAESAQLRLKGKAVFQREIKEQANRENARRDKEAAAQRARVEAAERGRIASREWAEKQKARVAAMKKLEGSGTLPGVITS
jgi:hypothetical protein